MNEENCKKFNGLYKGTVVSNIDPLTQGRLLVRVPDALGSLPCVWAESASPLAGPQMGVYMVPPINAGVWVLFQNGDPNFAVWTGCWRGSPTDVPLKALSAPPGVPPILIQSTTQNKIIISNVPLPTEGIILETTLGELGPRIEITNTSITISAGIGRPSIKVDQAMVNINNGALTVVGPG